jgi:hypothetical protein
MVHQRVDYCMRRGVSSQLCNQEVSTDEGEKVQAARRELEEALSRNPWPDRSLPEVAAEVEAYNGMP